MTLSRVRLEEMHERHRGLTQSVAAAYQEAASVCFDRYHVSPLKIVLSDNGAEIAAEVKWVEVGAELVALDGSECQAFQLGVWRTRRLFDPPV